MSVSQKVHVLEEIRRSGIHVKREEWDEILLEDIFSGKSVLVRGHSPLHQYYIDIIKNRQVNCDGDYYENIIYAILQLLGHKKE